MINSIRPSSSSVRISSSAAYNTRDSINEDERIEDEQIKNALINDNNEEQNQNFAEVNLEQQDADLLRWKYY